MAVAHLYGLNPVPSEAPRAPRLSVEPEDFASVAELARSISGCARACIRLEDAETGEARLSFFPPLYGVRDLPAALLPDGRGQAQLSGPSLRQEMQAAGLPDLAFWAGFTLRSLDGRMLGVLCLMDEVPRELSETALAQLRLLAEILSRGIGMAASTIRAMARQSLGLMEDLAEVEDGAVSPAVTGLLRYAAGRVPGSGEAMAMRIAGLADMSGGKLLLTPTARDILYTHGFRLANPKTVEAEAPAEAPVMLMPVEVAPQAAAEFHTMARLRIGEVHHDIARDEETDKFAFRITGSGAPWVLLENGLEEGWPEMAAEIIKRTRNATFDYVRMHMIHNRDASHEPGEFVYDLYGMGWSVRGTPDFAEAKGADGMWRVFDASHISPDAPRDFSAQAAFAAIPDLADRIGADVHEWSKRIAAGSEVTPVFG
ncbi:hypothetical protein [Paragemmobacter ruber]|uniref:GAF domain-containing protein n=1 Tax=Paragemmobacter ruber TaxID=1985673 RepID=A0ABW9YBF8_9RHOB|nr:hypothetical protein [Rhodobacter ruber]NBE09170.1 hypothetical protein [Rhodobacter ruber]